MKTITLCWVSDCGGQNLRSRCHGARMFLTKYLNKGNSCSNKVTAAVTLFKYFVRNIRAMTTTFCWLIAKISRVHWLCILYGNPERLKRHSYKTASHFELVWIEHSQANLKATSQVHSCDPVTTCLQNIQPDHTVTIWKRNHLFFAVPVPMVQSFDMYICVCVSF